MSSEIKQEIVDDKRVANMTKQKNKTNKQTNKRNKTRKQTEHAWGMFPRRLIQKRAHIERSAATSYKKS